MGNNSKSAYKYGIQCGFTVTALAIFTVNSTNISAASMHPTKILCIPSKQGRAGIEDLPPIKVDAQQFEYSGKVTIKEEGNKLKYTYGEGKDTYKVKYKAVYSKDFVEPSLGLYVSEDYGWADPSGFLILENSVNGSKFHIDMKSLKYYGYDSDFGRISTYAGTCSIVSK